MTCQSRGARNPRRIEERGLFKKDQKSKREGGKEEFIRDPPFHSSVRCLSPFPPPYVERFVLQVIGVA